MDLQKAFDELDRMIEHCYRKKKFENNDDRLVFLYKLNQEKMLTINDNELSF